MDVSLLLENLYKLEKSRVNNLNTTLPIEGAVELALTAYSLGKLHGYKDAHSLLPREQPLTPEAVKDET